MLPIPSILRNLAVFASGEIGARCLGFFATALLTRRLGPESFGIIGFATAISGYLALAVNGGLNEVGGREVARRPEAAPEIYAGVLKIRIVIGSVAVCLLALISVLLPITPTTRVVVVLCGLSFFSLAADPTWVFRAIEHPLAAAPQVIAQMAYLAGVVFLVHDPGDVIRVPLVVFGGELAAAVIVGAPLLFKGLPKATWAFGRSLLRHARFLGAGRVLRTVVITFDVVLLGFLAQPVDLGLYTAAYRFCFLLMAIAVAVNAAYLPLFTRAAAEAPTRFRREVSAALSTSLIIGAPLVTGSIVIARPLLRLLFGPAFEAGAPAFMLLVAGMGFFFVHSLLANVFLVIHQTRAQAGIYAIAATANVLANVVLIPRYGIVGAATTTLFAEGLTAVLGLIILRRLGVWLNLLPLVIPGAAAALMAVMLLVIAPNWPVPAQVVIGGLLYASTLAAVVAVRKRMRSTEFRWTI